VGQPGLNGLKPVIKDNKYSEINVARHGYITTPFQTLPTLLLSIVPAAPENVTLTNSFPLLRVTWSNDPSNGVISLYTIYVTRLERGNTVLTNTSMNTQFDIPEGALDPYELVSVNVSASNSAGEGARSPGVRGRTREQRKSSTILWDPVLAGYIMTAEYYCCS